MVVLEFITCFGLWLPAEAIAPRILLCMVTLLMVGRLRADAAAALPEVSYSTYFDVYLLIAIFLSALSLMWNVGVCHLISHSTLHTTLFNGVGKVVLPIFAWVYFSLFLLVALEPIAVPIVLMVLGILVAPLLMRKELRAVHKAWGELKEQRRGDRTTAVEVLPTSPPQTTVRSTPSDTDAPNAAQDYYNPHAAQEYFPSAAPNLRPSAAPDYSSPRLSQGLVASAAPGYLEIGVQDEQTWVLT